MKIDKIQSVFRSNQKISSESGSSSSDSSSVESSILYTMALGSFFLENDPFFFPYEEDFFFMEVEGFFPLDTFLDLRKVSPPSVLAIYLFLASQSPKKCPGLWQKKHKRSSLSLLFLDVTVLLLTSWWSVFSYFLTRLTRFPLLSDVCAMLTSSSLLSSDPSESSSSL